MAVFRGHPPFVGSKYGLVVWKQFGQYYVRSRSTLDPKRVKNSPVFKKTMENAGILAKASPIASRVYKDWIKKEKGDYRMLTGEAMTMIRNGMDENEVELGLRKLFRNMLIR